MKRHFRIFHLGRLACLLLGLATGLADEPAAAPEPAKATDNDLRMRGVFDSALPGTERKNSLRLIVHPHFGDFTKIDHIRTAVGIRYGVTRQLEATAEVDTYFSHGLKKESFFEEKGLSGMHLGTKYKLGDPFRIGWDTAVGVDWSEPVGTPPPDVTDGLRHLASFVTISHQLTEHPAWRVFAGVNHDDVAATGTAGELSKNQLTGDNVGISGGFLYERGPLTYTFEASYNTMHPLEDSGHDLITLRPGIVWVIPQKYTPGSKGKWLLGFGLRLSRGVDGYDVGASAKLRLNFDFKRLLGLKTASGLK